MKPRKSELLQDQTISVTWRDLGLKQGEFLESYGLTTLASLQLITAKDFGKLFRVGPPMVNAVTHYLEANNRRFRKPREPFRSRARLLYGSIQNVPTTVAAIAGGLYASPGVLNRDLKLKTLKDVSKMKPETLRGRLDPCFVKTWEGEIGWFRRKYGISPEGNVAAFVQWLEDQGVW